MLKAALLLTCNRWPVFTPVPYPQNSPGNQPERLLAGTAVHAKSIEPIQAATIPAMIIKKAGISPRFGKTKLLY